MWECGNTGIGDVVTQECGTVTRHAVSAGPPRSINTNLGQWAAAGSEEHAATLLRCTAGLCPESVPQKWLERCVVIKMLRVSMLGKALEQAGDV